MWYFDTDGSAADDELYAINQRNGGATLKSVPQCVDTCLQYRCCLSFSLAFVNATHGQCKLWSAAAASLQGTERFDTNIYDVPCAAEVSTTAIKGDCNAVVSRHDTAGASYDYYWYFIKETIQTWMPLGQYALWCQRTCGCRSFSIATVNDTHEKGTLWSTAGATLEGIETAATTYDLFCGARTTSTGTTSTGTSSTGTTSTGTTSTGTTSTGTSSTACTATVSRAGMDGSLSDYDSFLIRQTWTTLSECTSFCQQTSGCRSFSMVFINAIYGQCTLWAVHGATLEGSPRPNTNTYEVSCAGTSSTGTTSTGTW
eukprot:TRINITY_DN5427_c0_g1_i1.p1 TRINITY_DN5427_c0_g1~~TRINITY_DN5427_c0_g1_i1.p1  ORF type:complete len:314 (+),score=78.89 TRINITY_DN5427_c0_g1_i1:324-1265(+)